MRLIITALTGVLLLSACGKPDKKDTPTPDADVAVTTPETPGVKPESQDRREASYPDRLTHDESYLEADIAFPKGLETRAPKVANVILKESRIDLSDMVRSAKIAAEEDNSHAYSLSSTWTITGEAGSLISLQKSTYAFTGGAHGNTYLNGRVYETATGERVQISDLFADESVASVAVIDAVREAIAQQKAERYGLSGALNDDITGEVADAIPQAGSLPTEIALLSSTEAGKFGGMVVMYSPYEIGAYAEGSYEGVVGQDVFSAFLKPAFADLFAGAPIVAGE